MRFFWGLVGIGIGFLLIRYSFPMVNLFGHIPWAERHLGGGGTYTLYKIVGVIVIILSMLFLFNLLGFITSSITPYFGAGQ